MIFRRFLGLFPIAGLMIAPPGSAADEKGLHYLVSDVRFSESLPGINLGLRNQSTIKTVAQRNLTVTGNER